MRLPLLIHGKPSTLKSGARVFLTDGDWTFEHDVVDSRVNLRVEHSVPNSDGTGNYLKPSEFELNGKTICVKGPCVAQIYIMNPGTEFHISVYAASVGDR